MANSNVQNCWRSAELSTSAQCPPVNKKNKDPASNSFSIITLTQRIFCHNYKILTDLKCWICFFLLWMQCTFESSDFWRDFLNWHLADKKLTMWALEVKTQLAVDQQNKTTCRDKKGRWWVEKLFSKWQTNSNKYIHQSCLKLDMLERLNLQQR